MQQNNNETMYREDEIDLRKLIHTILKNKIIILAITSIATLSAIIYALSATPIFEAKAIIEIGQYKQADKELLVDNAIRLVKELDVIYIDLLKAEKGRLAWIEKISALKGQNNFIEIKARAFEGQNAENEIQNVVTYIADKHQKKINEVIENKKKDLKDIERKIKFLHTNTLPTYQEKIELIEKETLPSLDKKIEIHEKLLRQYEEQLSAINKSLHKTKQKNASLSALDLMEKRNLEDHVELTKLKLVNLEMQKKEITTTQLPKLYRDKESLITNDLNKLEEIKTLILLDLQPHNYQNSAVVGKIIKNEKPVKPKKKLIIVVGFIGGLILSLLFIFTRIFLKSMREDTSTL